MHHDTNLNEHASNKTFKQHTTHEINLNACWNLQQNTENTECRKHRIDVRKNSITNLKRLLIYQKKNMTIY